MVWKIGALAPTGYATVSTKGRHNVGFIYALTNIFSHAMVISPHGLESSRELANQIGVNVVNHTSGVMPLLAMRASLHTQLDMTQQFIISLDGCIPKAGMLAGITGNRISVHVFLMVIPQYATKKCTKHQ